MENNLDIIKNHLPRGYEEAIAKKVGCSRVTVHNILNSKAPANSGFWGKVVKVAVEMAEENIKTTQRVAETAETLKNIIV
ncbi:hypothetical protein EZS27_000842 [termite gut metagenome]|uniref:Uncharacterized protein n=1 Tax=termite gut metagenome TaxID=433724 RepID=A0A5J4T2K8_9ZZZZ